MYDQAVRVSLVARALRARFCIGNHIYSIHQLGRRRMRPSSLCVLLFACFASSSSFSADAVWQTIDCVPVAAASRDLYESVRTLDDFEGGCDPLG